MRTAEMDTQPEQLPATSSRRCDECDCPMTVPKAHAMDVEYQESPRLLRRVWKFLCVGCWKKRPKQEPVKHQRHCG